MVHLCLLTLATLPFGFLLYRSKRKARSSDLWLLLLALIVIPTGVLMLSQSARDYERPFLAGYLIYFLVVIVVTMWVISVRLKRQSGRTPIAAIIGVSLLLFFVIGLSLPAVPSAREAARRMQERSRGHTYLLFIRLTQPTKVKVVGTFHVPST
jgi:drug/metabolite transporter superfamily protein YnfA